jgi:hypothetical protein
MELVIWRPEVAAVVFLVFHASLARTAGTTARHH